MIFAENELHIELVVAKYATTACDGNSIVFIEGEPEKDQVVKEYLTTAFEGKNNTQKMRVDGKDYLNTVNELVKVLLCLQGIIHCIPIILALVILLGSVAFADYFPSF